jgi:hypothetical protein
MAINKKIKSFSPYNYNVQYAKPGAGINQKGKQYVKSSPVNQEEYVISKRKPNFFTFMSNVFHYTINDECEIKFLKAVSTITVRKDTNIKEFEGVSTSESKMALINYTVTNKPTSEYAITSSKSVQLNHSFYTSNVDCIALLNDEKYLKFKIKKINERSVELIFKDDINLLTIDYIKIILFPLENSFNILTNNISYSIYENKDLIIDDLKEVIAIDNKIGTSKLIPIVYDMFDSSYLLDGFDLSPCYISFNQKDFQSIKSLTDENEKLNRELMVIRNENLNLSIEQLMNTNKEYIEKTNKFKENERIINTLINVGYEYNISKVLLYKINKESYIKNLRYNVNTDSITWLKEDTNIVAIIKHNLNCDVKVILDRESITNYDIYKIDSNTIKINFGDLKPKTCVLNIFKVA